MKNQKTITIITTAIAILTFAAIITIAHLLISGI